MIARLVSNLLGFIGLGYLPGQATELEQRRRLLGTLTPAYRQSFSGLPLKLRILKLARKDRRRAA